MQALIADGGVDPDALISVTGHSLGGALAMLAAHDIATEMQPGRMQACRHQSYPSAAFGMAYTAWSLLVEKFGEIYQKLIIMICSHLIDTVADLTAAP